jgi:hypothetical protein
MKKNFDKWNWCLKEIDSAVARGKRLYDSEAAEIATIKHRLSKGIEITDKKDSGLFKTYQRMTEPTRIKW